MSLNPDAATVEKLASKLVRKGKLDGTAGDTSLRVDDKGMVIHMRVDDGYCFVVITPREFRKSFVYQLLDELAPAFQDAHGAAFESVSKEEALSKKALKLLRGIMTKYSDPSRVSKIAEIEVKVAEVQAQMQDNIDKALARQERVNTVDGKAETMADSSKTFFQRSRNVRRTVQMRYYKLVCIMATVVIVILLYILLPLLM